MRQFTILVFSLLLSATLSAESLRGFLLTKDNHQLTGYFNFLEYSPTGNYIVFTNDFGDVYNILPQFVKGFGFTEDGETFRFISRFNNGQWFFLHEDTPGRTLSLYRLPDGSQSWVDDRMLRLFTTPPPQYYFVFNDKIAPIPRAGFKRVLREFFAEASPGLAAKIGKRGYRYRNLREIVVEFNETRGRQRRRL